MRPTRQIDEPQRPSEVLLPLGELLGTIDGLLGNLTNTLSDFGRQATGTLNQSLQGLLASVLQTREQALSGDPEAERTYNRAIDLLRDAADQGRQDAADLLEQLGETISLDEEP